MVLRSLAGGLSATALQGNPVTLALQALGSHQTLDLGGLGGLGLALLGDGTADDELADIVLLVEAEETLDLGGALGAESLGDDGVGETGELALTLLDDAQGQNGEIEVGDGCMGISITCFVFHSFAGRTLRFMCDGGPNIPPRTDLRLRSPVRRGR